MSSSVPTRGSTNSSTNSPSSRPTKNEPSIATSQEDALLDRLEVTPADRADLLGVVDALIATALEALEAVDGTAHLPDQVASTNNPKFDPF